MGGAALVYIITTLHLPAKRVSHKVDYLGGALLGLAATALVLLATWGGTEYRWGSWEIIGLGLLAVAAAVGFCAVELRVAEPILPLHVLKNRNFSVTMALTFLTGLAMFGAMTFPAAVPADRPGRFADPERLMLRGQSGGCQSGRSAGPPRVSWPFLSGERTSLGEIRRLVPAPVTGPRPGA